MSETPRRFIPAAGRDWLLPLYDPFQRLFGGDAAREMLVSQASIASGHRVLDIGCGTGSLSLAIARRHPGAVVTGLDPDPNALARAERKAEREGLKVRFERGFADALPHPPGSFDRVVCSLMLHHLKSDEKRRTLAEVLRVLAPGGQLHALDFGSEEGHSGGLLARWFHPPEHLHDNLEGRLPALMRAVGFAEAGEVGHRATLFGRLAYYRAIPA